MLVVAVINADTYSFLFSQNLTLTPGIQEYLISGCTPSTGTNTRVILVSCRTWKCIPTVISGVAGIPEIPGYHLL